ncbi:serine/threonine-protein kinase [Erythrobacter sp. EC-HK427]|uniref:serine/threonine-protein kinase n=1 Tax=Erythrobacter sp. EC-HK427 TaxID=2038396 RepID=UPI001250E1FE|nr:serine/threonine-protein kinase [Erythrobacter sp. EC-HK427]VVT15882.1 putative Mitogen-activated protein kinase kinase kinase [Erythrobacter sp. EC-HK427]
MAGDVGGGGTGRLALAPGTVLNNNYRILESIGEGGMGAVYRAANIFMEEDHVAIKVIRAEQADDDLFKQMFGKEVKAMLRLNNPRLVAYRTFAHDPALDLSFIVTEFIDGPSLKSLIGKRQFSPQELLSLLSELAIGLRAAHKAGIVHRDMAPDNILLEDGDIERPKIIDFGIVKDTAGDGTTIIGSGFAGKYNFVAPEQLGEPDYPIGPWTDIFSLALVIVGLARGKSINMGNTPGAAIRMRRELPDLSAIAEPMRPMLAAMLAPHPENRLRSADDVLGRVGPIFTALEEWVQTDGDELEKTVMFASATTPMALYGEEEDDDDGVTEVVPVSPEAFDQSDFEDDPPSDPHTKRSGKLVWIILGLVAAGALAAVGGMLLGEYASVPGSRDDETSASAPVLAPTATPTIPIEAPPAPPPRDLLPQVAVATSLAPDAGRIPIAPESWVRQQDLPRQMYGNGEVTGVIAAYLTVAPGGSVTGCTIGGSSQVTPPQMRNASATSVCRALQANARFEPLPEPAPSPTVTATVASEALEQAANGAQEIAPPTPVPTATGTIAPPPQPSSEVFVRVAFRTVRPQTQGNAPE